MPIRQRLAHLDCLIEKAVSQQAHRGTKAWWECQTCEQAFTGAMQAGLGEAWWSRVCEQSEESAERLCAAQNLGSVGLMGHKRTISGVHYVC